MKTPLSKKRGFVFVVVGLAVVLISWWVWNSFGPKPLGDKLEYLGKSNYGCIWICDSQPGTMYYYETDMTPGEVVDYFKRARPEYPVNREAANTSFWLKNDQYPESAEIFYRTNDDLPRGLKTPSKTYTIKTSSKNYSSLLNSL